MAKLFDNGNNSLKLCSGQYKLWQSLFKGKTKVKKGINNSSPNQCYAAQQ